MPLPVRGLTPLASPMDLAVAVSSLKTLMLCVSEEAFREKENALRDALVCVVPSNIFPRDVKDSLQSFMLQLGGNCSALRIVVDKYNNLRNSIDVYNSNVLNLITHMDSLEEE